MKAWVWSEDRVTRLREMVADGLSAGQIMIAFGEPCTRNSVIGKVTRTGLQLCGNIGRLKGSVDVKPRAKAAQPDPVAAIAPLAPTPTMGAWKAEQEDARRAHNAEVKQKLAAHKERIARFHAEENAKLRAMIDNNEAGDHARAAAGHGVTLLELRGRSCRWPISPGVPSAIPFNEYLYCGDQVEGSSVYCACHSARAYTPRSRVDQRFSDSSVQKAKPERGEPEELVL
jgi:hypothetical protein